MIGVIGINHSSARLEIRESVGQALLSVLTQVPCLNSIPHVMLTTCNRTEWYFSSSRPLEVFNEVVAILRRKVEDPELHSLYSYFGVNCFIHLHRVVSGFDSAFIGETEIQGQIKLAYLQAIERKTLTSDLHYLFQKALHAGKSVRKIFTPKMQKNAQLELKIVEKMKTIEKLSLTSTKILLVGASMINQRICHALKHEGRYTHIDIASRTKAHAEEFASKFSISSLPLQEALTSWRNYDCIISAVKSQDYIIDHEEHAVGESDKRPTLVIDLGVPRNIDPMIASSVGQLENIETLGSSAELQDKETYRVAALLARDLAISYYKKMVLRHYEEKRETVHDKAVIPSYLSQENKIEETSSFLEKICINHHSDSLSFLKCSYCS